METNISHSGHRDRLHKRIFNNGYDNMPEHVKLEYMLTFVLPRKDVNPMAHALIDKYGSIRNLVTASSEELMNIKGIKEATANYLHLYAHLMGFAIRKHVDKPIVIDTTQKVADFVFPILSELDHEKLIIIYLDENYNLIEYAKFDGKENFVNLDISQVVNQLSMLQAKNIAIAHNHPSGIVLPSADDMALTQHFVALACTSAVQILDHVIIGEDAFYSFRSNNELEKFIRRTMKILPTAEVKNISYHPLPDDDQEVSDIEESVDQKPKMQSVRYKGDADELLQQEREGKVRIEIGKNGVVKVIKLDTPAPKCETVMSTTHNVATNHRPQTYPHSHKSTNKKNTISDLMSEFLSIKGKK